MKALQPYLMFDGNCREAMEFYQGALGGELFYAPYSEGPDEMPALGGERMMHARLAAGKVVLMASDVPEGQELVRGKDFSLSIECESREEEERLFAALAEDGSVVMPLQDTFWGSHFGIVEDRFGVRWQLDLPTVM